MQKLIEKAEVLIEALPYIQRFRNETIVVKFGGSAMEERAHHDGILADVTFMECVGMRPVIVHGGGKAISKRMSEKKLRPRFVQGLRVTDARAITVVAEVLRQVVNANIVATLEAKGARAKPVPGESVFRVRKKTAVDEATGETLDWGFVGDVQEVDTAPVLACSAEGVIPVITPLGLGADHRLYNINADDAAAALAGALKARKLAFLSDVPGLLRDRNDPESILSTLRIREVQDLTRNGVIEGGMLPKIMSGVAALREGVAKVHIIDGRMPHSLLLEIFTDKGTGTEIVHDD